MERGPIRYHLRSAGAQASPAAMPTTLCAAHLAEPSLDADTGRSNGRRDAPYTGPLRTGGCGASRRRRRRAVEGTILGLLAAGAIVVGLRPVQRLAERFASSVKRGVEDTPEYVEARKLDVYRAAVESAVEGGRITEKERAIPQGWFWCSKASLCFSFLPVPQSQG